MSDALVTRLDGPAPEREIALDMVRRGAMAAPALLLIGGIGWGIGGAASAGYAISLVLANFIIAAALLTWTARISLALMMGAALFGYVLRLAIVFAAVILVKDAGWVRMWPLGLSLVITHVGLLFWETRYISASLAFPGLKPSKFIAQQG